MKTTSAPKKSSKPSKEPKRVWNLYNPPREPEKPKVTELDKKLLDKELLYEYSSTRIPDGANEIQVNDITSDSEVYIDFYLVREVENPNYDKQFAQYEKQVLDYKKEMEWWYGEKLKNEAEIEKNRAEEERKLYVKLHKKFGPGAP